MNESIRKILMVKHDEILSWLEEEDDDKWFEECLEDGEYLKDVNAIRECLGDKKLSKKQIREFRNLNCPKETK